MIDLDGPEPLRDQVAQILRDRIADGTYPPRRRIPAEDTIADEFGVSRKTARAAVTILKAEGLVFTVPGRGTFVVEEQESGEK
jgi:GntR family transcriptional regulator